MASMMNGRRGRLTVEMLERLERKLAEDRIRELLARIPDPVLAEIVATRNGAALAGHGITAELVRLAMADPDELEPAEWERRVREIFDLPPGRKARIREYLAVYE
jgi:hypothetical protein